MKVLTLDSQIMRGEGSPLTITAETIKKTCDWFAQNALNCIKEVEEGLFVNDKEKYFSQKRKEHENYKTGNFKIWLGFWQKAYYIQTGKSVGILG